MQTLQTTTRRGRRTLALLAALALAAASCGGDDDDGQGAESAPDTTEAAAETTAAETTAAETTAADSGTADTSADTTTETTMGDTTTSETTAPSGGDADTPAAAPEPGPGFDGETIKVGVLTALSGPAALIGTQLAAGQQVYFDYLNAELGGVAGKYPVEIVLEDHLYDTSTTVQKYAQVKDDVVMFSQVMGTPSVFALLPLLDEDGIVASPASQDAFWVREQQLLPVIEPYQIDVINAMSYYLGDGGGSTSDTICAVIQNDVYGEAGLQGLEFAADQMGFEIAAVARYAAGDQSFTAQVTTLANADCDMVFATALPTEFGGITGTAAQSGFAPRWIAQSPAWVDELAAGPLGPYLEENVWIAALGREWGDPASTEMTAMVDRVAKYRPEQQPDYYFTFGYLQAWAADQVLEAAIANGDLSREGIVNAMNGLSELDFGDLSPAYTYGPPEDRNPPRGTTVFEVDTTKPFSLGALVTNMTSPEAEAYVFPEAG
jgi:ABC-type branched-subunit amino acid transport system substrate-binding protein